jgi:hypothetical protein
VESLSNRGGQALGLQGRKRRGEDGFWGTESLEQLTGCARAEARSQGERDSGKVSIVIVQVAASVRLREIRCQVSTNTDNARGLGEQGPLVWAIEFCC